MAYLFDPPAISAIPVFGSAKLFPVRRITCVGRNYDEHVREMGGDPDRNPPFFFAKPADALVHNGATIRYPSLTADFHHEIELVVAIGKTAFAASPEEAEALIFGFAVGIDLTRRDLQRDAMNKGHPWEIGKAFDQSAPCGPIHPIAETGMMSEGRIWLRVNGEIRQDGNIRDLIWSVPEIISILSRSVELRPGDLIYTGTPAGVGSMVAGDRVAGGIDGLGEIKIAIGAPRGA